MQIDNSVFKTTENTGNVILKEPDHQKSYVLYASANTLLIWFFFLYLSKTYYYRNIVILDAM